MKYYIGFDIGGTKCAVSLGEVENEQIKILAREEVPTSMPVETLEKLSVYVEEFQKIKKIEGAGISCGGPLDTQKGVILTPPNLPSWRNFPLSNT